MRTTTDRPTTTAHLDAGLVEYRWEQRGDATVVVFHGGHVRAGLAVGENVFAEAGYTILAPSRPGYGRTPLSTGTTVTGFADVTRTLCAHLGITKVAAVIGTSGGGPTTPDVTAAVRQPTLVIATRNDGGVPFAHARALTAAIRHAHLVESHADSHLIWLARDWPNIAETIRVFLTTDPPRYPPAGDPHAESTS